MLNVIGPLIILSENPFPSPLMPSVAIRLINVCLQNYIAHDFCRYGSKKALYYVAVL